VTDAEMAEAMTRTAAAYVLPEEPDARFVEAVRTLFEANLPVFLAAGFDAETARFLACALAAREMHLAGGAVGRG
jgi:hypothetical protein